MAEEVHSDDPTISDALNHAPHVRDVGELIKLCNPPYVLGIDGDWGSGKTSFLKKLHLYLADRESDEENAEKKRQELWKGISKCDGSYEPIWFEAWRYQFEPNPVVALLNEIRAHFTWSSNLVGKAGKLTFAALMSIEDLTRKIGIQPSKTVEAGEKWERDHLAQPLPSKVCRDLLEQAIQTILRQGKKKRMIIFVDDLDRCQGQVTFRLLEAMKIYLSIPSCIFVLGLDLRNVQRAVAAELKPSGMEPDQEPVAQEFYAADYLSKIFQSVYHIPSLSHMEGYLRSLMTADVFGKPDSWIKHIVQYDLLPLNPRKIKFFVNGLALYLKQIKPRLAGKEFDVPLTLIVTYLNLLAHNIYRIVEADNDFWIPLGTFCRTGTHDDHPALKLWKLPDTPTEAGEDTYTYTSAFHDPANERVFRAARLIRECKGERPTDDEFTAYFLRSK